MNIGTSHYRTIWIDPATSELTIIDQTALPHIFRTLRLHSVKEVCRAIRDMHVRGAGLVGATAGYGMWIAARTAPSEAAFPTWMEQSAQALLATRPTATNLAWAVARQQRVLQGLSWEDAIITSRREAEAIADEDAENCRCIGRHGLELIRQVAERKNGEPVNILTHCNAGWLAFVDYGSALAPVYAAQEAGIPVHVWVDETRPRNQGASLTAWELGCHGVPHHLIVDNAGGHLMQHGLVDMVLTGADRVTRTGDVANKIGTYLKALAAMDNQVPFYVALPSSTLDFSLSDGVSEIPIEERDPDEVRVIQGRPMGTPQGGEVLDAVLLCPEDSPACNWAFDVTPARLVTALITERGICPATEEGIAALFPPE